MHVSKILMCYKQGTFTVCNVPVNYHFRHWRTICDEEVTINSIIKAILRPEK